MKKTSIYLVCDADVIISEAIKDGDFCFHESNSSNASTKAVEISCKSSDCPPPVEFTQRQFLCSVHFSDRLSRPNKRSLVLTVSISCARFLLSTVLLLIIGLEYFRFSIFISQYGFVLRDVNNNWM